MTVFLYILIALASIYVGKIEKRVTVGIIAAPISVPIGIMTALGIFAISVYLFLFLALAIAFLAKLKVVIKLKIGALLAGIAATMLSGFIAPPIWIVTAILIILITLAVREAFLSIYRFFFKRLAIILMAIRRFFDNVRKNIPVLIHPLICIVEAGLVCSLALNGVWSLMDFVDGDTILTSTLIKYRILVLIPFALLLYRNYIKDTSHPNVGGEGVDSPVLIELVTIVDAIF